VVRETYLQNHTGHFVKFIVKSERSLFTDHSYKTSPMLGIVDLKKSKNNGCSDEVSQTEI